MSGTSRKCIPGISLERVYELRTDAPKSGAKEARLFWKNHQVETAVNDGASTYTITVTEPIDIDTDLKNCQCFGSVKKLIRRLTTVRAPLPLL